MWCERCERRWAQERGLCRSCARGIGLVVLSTVERERRRLARQQAALNALRRPVTPFVPYTRVADGTEYEVVWDGSVR